MTMQKMLPFEKKYKKNEKNEPNSCVFEKNVVIL